MIAYFDTSAIVPLVIAEPGSSRARSLWESADRVVSVRLVYPEARAALAHAHRLGRLASRQHRAAVSDLEARHDELDLVEIDDDLARRAGDLAETLALRGYDAVHLAAAMTIGADESVVVTGDRLLLSAAAAVGLSTALTAP
jgi:predicted nucleic acid-binding protein